MLSQKELIEEVSYSKDIGLFVRNGKEYKRCGNLHKGYIYICVKGKRYSAHRLAWLYVYGEHPNGQIDHINMDKADNRICNLRLATNSQNQMNTKLSPLNTTGFKGVSFNKSKGKFEARAMMNRKNFYIGCFDNPVDAHEAYARFAKLNFNEYGRLF